MNNRWRYNMLKPASVLLFLILSACGKESAASNWVSYLYPSIPCAPGTVNMGIFDGVCGIEGGVNYPAYWGDGQRLAVTSRTMSGIDGPYYVKFTGQYGLRMRWCAGKTFPQQGQNSCTISATTEIIDSPNKPIIRSNLTIGEQALAFGGAPTNMAAAGVMCFTLTDFAGDEWTIPGNFRFCSDGVPLADKPPSCLINQGTALDVSLGDLERSAIVSVPGTSRTVKKTFPVICDGDAQININMQLQYTPLSVNGDEVIQSSSTGLGVAVLYGGKPLSTTDSVPLIFQSGIQKNLDLEFEAIRDPRVGKTDIPTGKFTAHAVMVMTQQ